MAAGERVEPIDRGYEPIDAQEDLICPVCRNLLYTPTRTVCDHHFCKSCLEAATAERDVCPLCREPFPGGAEASRLVRGLLAKQRIRCLFGSCGAEMAFEQWDAHQEDCEHAELPCPHNSFGCAERPSRRQLAAHTAVCQFRPLSLPRAVLSARVDAQAANCCEDVIDLPLRRSGVLTHRNAATFRLQGNDVHILRSGVISVSLSIVARARPGWAEEHERYHGIGVQMNGDLVAYSLFPRRVQTNDCVAATLTHHAETRAGDVLTFRVGMGSKRLVDDLQARDVSIRWDSME
eukprot:TRINITY_DN52517_c0_g1_i1.p2 TRINITY_DN52517_c0_g1~~TRINITY_DN52517_c0_g1_i1.p2  ORF type:complete len:326 (+),score=87.96 TRINITY_DN52517_c0_g1_i1:103-978(+)